MAWGSEQEICSSQAIAGTPFSGAAIALNPGESARIHTITDSGGTTDSLQIEVQTTLKDSPGASDWVTVADYTFVLDATSGDPESVEFTVSGPFKFRVVLSRVGSTDTLTTDCDYRLDGISV